MQISSLEKSVRRVTISFFSNIIQPIILYAIEVNGFKLNFSYKNLIKTVHNSGRKCRVQKWLLLKLKQKYFDEILFRDKNGFLMKGIYNALNSCWNADEAWNN
jgi:hypothetical protein